jgi:hypothetical protein
MPEEFGCGWRTDGSIGLPADAIKVVCEGGGVAVKRTQSTLSLRRHTQHHTFAQS